MLVANLVERTDQKRTAFAHPELCGRARAAGPDDLPAAFAQRPALGDEQRAAATTMTACGNAVLVGLAVTGKVSTIDTICEAFEHAGWTGTGWGRSRWYPTPE